MRKVRGSIASLFLFAIFVAALALAYAYAAGAGPFKDRYTHVLKLDINGIVIKPAIARGSGERFSDMVHRLKPYAAINGTYYDERTESLGDIVINGEVANRGGQRHAIAVTKSGKVVFLYRGNKRFKWSGYISALAAGPRLVHRGQVALDPVADGFSRASLRVVARRSGVGITKDGKLLLVAVTNGITLAEFADKMLKLGAVEAMNLDGGGATALYFNGKLVTEPTLVMSNILAVYKK